MKPLIALILWIICLAWPARAEWREFSPAGAVDGQGIMQDVLSRITAEDRRSMYDASQVTYTHEATHALNARIRNSAGGTGKVNAFYVGGGRCCVLPEPKTTLASAARRVREFRNSTYQLYFLDQQQHWNNEPLYVFDEWSAYLNGSKHAVETGDDEHGSHERSNWFAHYADAVVEAVRADDPSYAKLNELTEFVAFQKQRTAQLTGARPSTLDPRPPLLAPRSSLLAPRRSFLIDMPREYREQNFDGSCGYISVANCMRFCGLWREARLFRQRYGGGCTDESISRALNESGVQYKIGHDGDERLMRWGVETGRGAAVCWGGAHCVNLVGIEGDTAVLMGNGASGIRAFRRESWQEFIKNHRASGGWSVVVVSGAPAAPEAVPTTPPARPQPARPE